MSIRKARDREPVIRGARSAPGQPGGVADQACARSPSARRLEDAAGRRPAGSRAVAAPAAARRPCVPPASRGERCGIELTTSN
ncbi:hypothetical protein D0U02_34855 [Burkholderia pseudomallei]|uniref:Uncharacterized protein n=2 Tax=Burkholderia pseudomallei TaxID=28450 RepID=A0A0E1VUL0_BURPE|nr:hypothetical protein BURPS1106A_A2758 [Burkholderia pseudomallei 1106a]AYE32918.1 hypothetical protein CNX72_36305 [Burkholderia pseudomallei]EEC34363.1 conserved hypothetical protein [Burkholderia pseudomallei 576]EEP49935.1 conserved hypothetical protein [Burkholderia pseudomallei MSHR346]EES21418.1 hypothetical protein BURPS1106B_2416 [Burkholderia pseudomallei 1106b]EET03809.1 hypothetical protein BURPS1710A_A2048 [Burkholderia pseudomallei 1710a]PNX05664.1 hypothetical protein CF649_0